MKRTFAVVFLVVLALFFARVVINLIDIALLAPWQAQQTLTPAPYCAYRGSVHIHSRHSDGSGSMPEILRAGKRCDLDFLLISDHNVLALRDSIGTGKKPLALVGTELSLSPGHLLTYGLTQIPDENKAGGVAGIIDSIWVRGGFAGVAHPLHPRMRWRGSIPAHAEMEVINADVVWRRSSPLKLLSAIFAYPFSDHAMNLLIETPQRELHLWDSLTAKQPLVGIGSVDAHARIKLSKNEYWKFPGYANTFALVQTVVLSRDSLASAVETARQEIADAFRAGNLLFGFSGLGDLRSVAIWYENPGGVDLPGEKIDFLPNTPGNIHVNIPAGLSTETYLYHNGVRIASSQLTKIIWPVDAPGTYRVAVYQRRAQFPFLERKIVPWVYANPFYLVQP